MVIEIVPIMYHTGFFNAICNTKSWTPRLETYYIVNYLFKYWELADTLFLVVKKKPLGEQQSTTGERMVSHPFLQPSCMCIITLPRRCSATHS